MQLNNPGILSSPTSTGGGGTIFEEHVGAFFLALLLVNGIPPVLKDCQVEEVRLQSGVDGWNTDDILITGSKGTGSNARRHLALQVKRSFTISASDDACKKAFLDFWKDFNSTDRFNLKADRLGLVVLRGTDRLLGTFNSLLDCARASLDGADFASRISKPGHIGKDAKIQAGVIRAIVSADSAVSDQEFWLFLKVLHVISLDLNTATGQGESWVKALLAQTAHASDPMSSAELTWGELLALVGAGMPVAAVYTRSTLPEGMRDRHSDIPQADRSSLYKLIDHGETVLSEAVYQIICKLSGFASQNCTILQTNCYTAFDSVERILGFNRIDIEKFLKSLDANKSYEQNPHHTQPYEDWLFSQVLAVAPKQPHIDRVHWFHLTRTATPESFARGIFPLGERIEEIWQML